jgi:hypothetical protein
MSTSNDRVFIILDDPRWFYSLINAITFDVNLSIIVNDEYIKFVSTDNRQLQASVCIPSNRFIFFSNYRRIFSKIRSADLLESLAIILALINKDTQLRLSLNKALDTWTLEIKTDSIHYISYIKSIERGENDESMPVGSEIGNWSIISREFRNALNEIRESADNPNYQLYIRLSAMNPYIILSIETIHGICKITYPDFESLFVSFQCTDTIEFVLTSQWIETAIKSLGLSNRCCLICYQDSSNVLRVLLEGDPPMFLEVFRFN